jgi:integrase
MPAVGRKRTKNLHLPPRMRIRKGRYFYDTQAKPRREIPLGGDYGAALVKWAELEGKGLTAATTQPTWGMAWTRYLKDVLPLKAPRTQADNMDEAANLLKVFKDAPLARMRPTHVRDYLDIRGKAAQVRANREKALLSHVFNKAREWGYTDAPNPCQGVKGFREDGREKYVEEAEFLAVYAQACIPVRNAMDLAYLSGQRPADVLKATIRDVRDGSLAVKQGKTGAKVRITLVRDGIVLNALGELVVALQPPRTGKVTSAYLIRNEDEQPLTYSAMTQRFSKARDAAIEHAQDGGQTALAASLKGFQFRDLRAKAATDLEDLRAAQGLLAHASAKMTEDYVRARAGSKVHPVK